MKIRTEKFITGDKFQVNIYAEEYSQLDLELMQSYGEPAIDIGGSFTGPPSFTLPDNYVRIKSDSPFVASFDGHDYADAEDRANVWTTEVIVLLKDAIDTLRAHSDVYTGESVETY